MLPSLKQICLYWASQCSMKHQKDSSDVYMQHVCLHLTRIYKHRWMVSENTEHLSSSLTNSDWKSMSIRLTHDSECRLYFISDCNMMPSGFKTWPISDEPRIRDLAVTLMIKHELLFQLITLKRVKLKREEQMRLNLTSAPVR